MTGLILQSTPISFYSRINWLEYDYYLIFNDHPAILSDFYSEKGNHSLSLIILSIDLTKVDNFLILKEEPTWFAGMENLKLIKNSKLFPEYLLNGYLKTENSIEPVYLYQNYCFYKIGGRIKVGNMNQDCYQNLRNLLISNLDEKNIIDQILIKNPSPSPYLACQIINSYRDL